MVFVLSMYGGFFCFLIFSKQYRITSFYSICTTLGIVSNLEMMQFCRLYFINYSILCRALDICRFGYLQGPEAGASPHILRVVVISLWTLTVSSSVKIFSFLLAFVCWMIVVVACMTLKPLLHCFLKNPTSHWERSTCRCVSLWFSAS